MATTATAAPTTTTAATPEGKKFVAKPERPDEDHYRKAEAAAKKEYEDVQQQLSDVKAKLEAARPGGSKNPRQEEIKSELADLRQKQAAKKSSRAKLEDEIRALQENINARVKELTAKRSSTPFRNVAEIEEAVQRLEAKVESGTMRVVDEKKAIQEMSNLNRLKRNFPQLDDLRAAIEANRAKLKTLKEGKRDPEVDVLSERYNKLDAEFRAIKDEQDVVYQNLNHLRDERARLQDLQNEKWAAIKAIQDELRQARNNYRAYEREARRIREARRAQEQAEYALQKKRTVAAQRMEAASQPAFASEIITCEKLVAFFDPSSAEAAKNARLAAAPRELAAKAVTDARQYESKKPMKVLERKEEEDFFVGGGGKKKKGKKPREDVTETSKIDLNLGLLEELARVDVPVPSSKEEVSAVLEKLRGKLQYYKDNQDKVTKQNIAKAQKEIEKLEKDFDHKPASSSSTTATAAEETTSACRTATPAVDETKEEEKGETEVDEVEEAKGENEENEGNKENESNEENDGNDENEGKEENEENEKNQEKEDEGEEKEKGDDESKEGGKEVEEGGETSVETEA